MAFDYKKEYKDLYQPKTMPAIVMVPAMRFVAVDGVGDPNEEGGDYAKAMQLLYGISFTVKMSQEVKEPGRAYRRVLRLHRASAGGLMEHGGGCARRRLRAQSRLPLDFDDSSAGIRDR